MLKTICVVLGLCSSISGQPRVIDGDTIAIGSIHIRLNGIDAEELNEQNGHKAKRALEMLVEDREITCRLNGERSYNRYIGQCFSVEKYDIGADMVQFGYALDCPRYSGGRYAYLEPTTIRAFLKQKPYCLTQKAAK